MKKKKKVKKNYFNKFWDGELSLPVSYWLFGFVYPFLIGFFCFFVGTIIGISENVLILLIYLGQFFGRLVVGGLQIGTKV